MYRLYLLGQPMGGDIPSCYTLVESLKPLTKLSKPTDDPLVHVQVDDIESSTVILSPDYLAT